MTKSSPLLLRCLYRNLLRAVKPFSSPSPNGRVLNSLLHRTGIDDHIDDWKAYVSKSTDPVQTRQERARDLTYSYSERISDEGKENATPPPNRTQQILFRRLLREVVAGPEYGFQKMIFPSQVDTNRLREVVRREFRNTPESISLHFNFDSFTREQVAWTALRELNKKLSYFDDLLQSSPTPLLPQQAASNVSPLPFSPPSSYLRPGSFLVSHPHMMDCFFGKTVICILDHKTVSNETNNADPSIENDEDSSDDDIKSIPGQATYGLIINRISVNPETQENKTLKEVFEEEMLPSKLADVFGSDSIVREGGPVPEPIQIVYSVAADNTDEDSLAAAVGGKLIPGIPDSDDSSTSIYSDRATYFKGNLMKAMVAVDKGSLDRDDISFFVGASTWTHGQLENEIEQGFWIPCRGPPEVALTGICEHEPTAPSEKRPLADLWLSMMSACGEDEGKLAHLFHDEEEWDENGMACDACDDDDIEFLF